MNIIKTIAYICAFMFSTATYSQTTLRVATWLPPTSGQNDVVWPTWGNGLRKQRKDVSKLNWSMVQDTPSPCSAWLKMVWQTSVSV